MPLITTRNGEEVELTMSGNGNAPDDRGGQHTNVSTLWVRLPGQPYRRVMGFRSSYMARLHAEAAASAAAAMALLTEDDA